TSQERDLLQLRSSGASSSRDPPAEGEELSSLRRQLRDAIARAEVTESDTQGRVSLQYIVNFLCSSFHWVDRAFLCPLCMQIDELRAELDTYRAQRESHATLLAEAQARAEVEHEAAVSTQGQTILLWQQLAEACHQVETLKASSGSEQRFTW